MEVRNNWVAKSSPNTIWLRVFGLLCLCGIQFYREAKIPVNPNSAHVLHIFILQLKAYASYHISPSNRLAHPAQIRFYTYPESPVYVACNTSPLAAFNIASSLFLCLLTSKLLSLSRRLLSFCSSSSRSSCNSTSVGSHGVAFVSSSSSCRIPASLRFLMSMAFSTRRGPEGVTGDEGEVVVEVATGRR